MIRKTFFVVSFLLLSVQVWSQPDSRGDVLRLMERYMQQMDSLMQSAFAGPGAWPADSLGWLSRTFDAFGDLWRDRDAWTLPDTLPSFGLPPEGFEEIQKLWDHWPQMMPDSTWHQFFYFSTPDRTFSFPDGDWLRQFRFEWPDTGAVKGKKRKTYSL